MYTHPSIFKISKNFKNDKTIKHVSVSHLVQLRFNPMYSDTTNGYQSSQYFKYSDKIIRNITSIHVYTSNMPQMTKS